MSLNNEIVEKIIKNFNTMFSDRKEKLFAEPSSEQRNKLKELVGDNVDQIIDFYSNYEPYEMPMTPAYTNLLDIDSIIEESTDGEPGKFLSEFGLYVIAVTVGGNLVCIDTNDAKDGDASILLVDHCFCYYDEDIDRIEIDMIPKSIEDDFAEDNFICLNYPNIKKCVLKLEDSFFSFLLKLSEDKYGDLEDILNEFLGI